MFGGNGGNGCFADPRALRKMREMEDPSGVCFEDLKEMEEMEVVQTCILANLREMEEPS